MIDADTPMPNRNIYFTDEIAKQMKNFAKENWSSVCQEAVASHIRLLMLKSEAAANAVERAKARLASERAGYVADGYDRGKRDGMAWAADHATFDQLRRIDFGVNGGPEDPPFVDERFNDGKDSVRMVAKLACGAPPDTLGDETLTADEHAFIVSLCNAIGLRMDGGDIDSVRYWDGFVAGALAIFKQL
jgi:hypothetical protein